MPSKLNVTRCTLIGRIGDKPIFEEDPYTREITVNMDNYLIAPAEQYKLLTQTEYQNLLLDLDDAYAAIIKMSDKIETLEHKGKKLRYPLKPRTI